MARDGVTIERCFGSRKSLRMLLPGGFPKGNRGVEWAGALAGKHPRPSLFLQKAGMPHTSISGQRITRPEAKSILPSGAPPLQRLPLCAALRCSADLVVNY